MTEYRRKKTFHRLDKPQPNEWFKLFNLGKSFIPATITTQRDERGDHQKYLLTNTKDKFVKKYAYDLRPSTQCRWQVISTGIIFIWPVNFNRCIPTMLGTCPLLE